MTTAEHAERTVSRGRLILEALFVCVGIPFALAAACILVNGWVS